MAARLQCGTTPASCSTSTGMPVQNAATFSNLSCQITSKPILHMVQNVADWIAPFSRSLHSPPPPLKFFSTPPSPLSSPSLPDVHESWGNHRQRILKRIFIGFLRILSGFTAFIIYVLHNLYYLLIHLYLHNLLLHPYVT